MRVLLADDDAIARLLVSRLMGSLGYQVVTAADVEGALRGLNEGDAPEVALIDWSIRGLDAASLCQRVRMNDNPCPAYIIALVSARDKQQRDGALESGCD